jgi:hypothetical protein
MVPIIFFTANYKKAGTTLSRINYDTAFSAKSLAPVAVLCNQYIVPQISLLHINAISVGVRGGLELLARTSCQHATIPAAATHAK